MAKLLFLHARYLELKASNVLRPLHCVLCASPQVRPSAQDQVTCLSLRRGALDALVIAARFAGFVKKGE